MHEKGISEKELYYLKDVDFLQTRHDIYRKINGLLLETESALKQYIAQNEVTFPEGTKFKAGKIAKGENYQLLPYFILDYPRLFSRKSIFALRTMFWWGHYFSSTFHLYGEALQQCKPGLLDSIATLYGQEVYLYIKEDDPWEHQVNEENYRLLDSWDVTSLKEKLGGMEHIKLSSILPLDQWIHLPEFTLTFFKHMYALWSLD